jgi:hypothetical protein
LEVLNSKALERKPAPKRERGQNATSWWWW